MEKIANYNEEFEAKQIFSLYSVDVVVTTGFGIEGKTFSDPHSVVKDQVGMGVWYKTCCG